MLKPTEKIWHNGRFIDWNDAKIHVLAHVTSYGSSVFEGIRCYATPSGPAIFRVREHIRRLLDSAKIYRIEVKHTIDELADAMSELVRVWLTGSYSGNLGFNADFISKTRTNHPASSKIRLTFA